MPKLANSIFVFSEYSVVFSRALQDVFGKASIPQFFTVAQATGTPWFIYLSIKTQRSQLSGQQLPKEKPFP